MKTRKIAAAVLCVLSVVTIFCFRLMSGPLTGAVTAAELGSALGALSLLPTVLAVALAFLLGDVVVSLLIGLSVGELMFLLVTGEKGAAQLLQIVPSIIDELIGVASDTENTKVLILCALVGGLVGVLMLLALSLCETYELLSEQSVWGARMMILSSSRPREGIIQTLLVIAQLFALLIGAVSLLCAAAQSLKAAFPRMRLSLPLCALALLALVGYVWTPYDPTAIVGSQKFLPPSFAHLFGTDNFGRDIFSRVLAGAGTTFLISAATVVIGAAVGTLVGAFTGYFGGWLDNVVMRLFDVIASIPGMLLIMVLVMALGVGVQNLIYALLISGVPGYARFVRSTILNLTDMEYVQCAKSYGTSSFKIILRHVLPNALGPIIIMLAGSVSGTILGAASYSFMGFGVQQPTPEWGAIISASRQFMRLSPTYAIIPGMAIVITAMSINLVGDGLRDALDPRLKD